jgi:hypothetical protein
MGQHPDLNPDPGEEDLEALGTPVYEGSGLSVRALTAEELQRFLHVHADQPGQRLGSGWGALDPPWRTLGVPRTAAAAGHEHPGPTPPVLAEPIKGSLGRPGRSALAQYRRRRSEELAGWTRGLAWRAPLVAAGLVAGGLAAQAGLPGTGLAGLAVAVLVGWRLLDRLGRDGYVVFHDLALPDSPANLDHLVIGPSGAFVIDSKQWTGQVHQSSDGLIWHHHYRLDRTLATIRWQAETLGRLLGVPAAPLICIHGAHVQGGGLRGQGVAIVPASLLRSALGYDQVLSEVDVERYAATARMRLRPAA